MFTDMVGFTALAQRNEALSLKLVEEQRTLVRGALGRHGGREVKTIGDGFLVEFTSALEAARCACEIQKSTNEFNLSRPEEAKVHLRIGLHIGDVTESAGDISGDAVNLASRIEALAEADGICMTRQVYDQIQNKFELPLVSLGPKLLKNVAAPVEVFKIVLPWSETDHQAKSGFDRKRVAVLPFANMSPDPNDEFFTDGMTEELITALSKIEDVEVISRTSVMLYKRAPKPIKDVARELEAGTVIEGSVRKSGNKLRVTVQMIDASRDRHLWADSYDRNMDDVFAIQSDISNRVSEALQARLPKGSHAEAAPAVRVGSYTTYLRAMQLMHEGTTEALNGAVSLLESAISQDPGFARAYAGLSRTWARLALGHVDWSLAVGEAETAAKKAVELDPNLAEAHAALAQVYTYQDRFDEELVEAEKAVSLNPSLSEGESILGLHYAHSGDLEKAYLHLRKASELDPMSLTSYSAIVAQLTGRKGEALEMLERWKKAYPRNPQVYGSLAEFYGIEGDYEAAQGALDLGFTLDPKDVYLLAQQGLVYAYTGRRKDAEKILEEISKEKVEAARLYGQAIVNSALGNMDEVFRVLDRQAVTHSWGALIKALPAYENVRRDPRFPAFCAKVGISSETRK